MLRFFVAFVALTGLLFGFELTPWGQRLVVEPWTRTLAAFCARLVTAFDPGVVATGKVIAAVPGGFSVAIEAGCNGIEATIVLAAAMLAFPAPWRSRLVGLACGFAAVQAANVVRVISLFYLGQWSLQAFEWAHLYLWQALIMLDVLIVWLVWVRLLPRTGAAAEPRDPPGGTVAPASA